MKKSLKSFGKFLLTVSVSIFVLIFVVIVAFFAIYKIGGYGKVYEVTSTEEYLDIKGNFENDPPREFIKSFFPKEIEDTFLDTEYHYKAKKFDAYAYECYLEFTVENKDEFLRILGTYVDVSKSVTFVYDNSFMDYTLSNVLYLQSNDNNDTVYPIGTAEIGKILYREEDNRFIFVALGLYDGGGTDTGELNHFFSRFNIDPKKFEEQAYASTFYQEQALALNT